MAEERDEGFLTRWSRRKRMTEAEATATDPTIKPVEDPDVVAARDAAEAARLAEEEANRLAAEAVDLDTLGYGDDFSLFLKRGVPDALRRDALRRFFVSDPLLANLDGLNDYDQDFNDPATLVYRSIRDPVRGFVDQVVETIRAPDGAGETPPAESEETAGVPATAPDAPASTEAAPAASDAEPTAVAALEPPSDERDVAVPIDPVPQPRRVSLRRRLEG
jgi:hypothetical protein